MENVSSANSSVPPVRIHFSNEFPIETRCATSDDEIAIVEVLKVEYGLDPHGDNFDVTFFISGIKSFSISDDDQECLIKWALKIYGSDSVISEGFAGTGYIEMGERFDEIECVASDVPSGDYLFEVIYV